jgi:virginiamycin A acetyltransferase
LHDCFRGYFHYEWSQPLIGVVSTFPFAIMGGDWACAMEGKKYPIKGDTIIGNDGWISYNATIMAGIKVGDGAIIATNSTIVKDVPPYAIVGGNSATVIMKHFSDEQIAALLKLQWWNWSIEKITANVQKLTGKNQEELLQSGELVRVTK